MICRALDRADWVEKLSRWPTCAVYLIFDQWYGVQYIGSSKNLPKRIPRHPKLFDGASVFAIECNEGLLSRLETLLIAWYDPPQNGPQPGRSSDRMFGATLGDKEHLRVLVDRVLKAGT